jgi:hypothetical protein
MVDYTSTIDARTYVRAWQQAHGSMAVRQEQQQAAKSHHATAVRRWPHSTYDCTASYEEHMSLSECDVGRIGELRQSAAADRLADRREKRSAAD